MLCKTIGGGSSVEPVEEEEFDEGTVPTTMGKHTDAGRADRGDGVPEVDALGSAAVPAAGR